MMIMRKRLTCCRRERESSFDFDEHNRVTTYNGLESYILSSHTYDNASNTSRGDGCVTDSLDEDDSSCSSSNYAFGSFFSHWTKMKRDDRGPDEWDCSGSPLHVYVKQKPAYMIEFSDVDTMKEKFAKLLLGEDVTGGSKGLSTALAVSNSIANLAACVFGELWKLEPLPEERKNKWEREMDWLLSPTDYMVELVPAKQNGANGGILEIMTAKARGDVHMNLPALRKLDCMLIEILDSMVNTEFWYAEGGSRTEGKSSNTRRSKRWWLPSPQVPAAGLSDSGRKKLLYQAKLVHQMFKAAKTVNENVLLEMPVPTIIRDTLPKSGKASVGEELYRTLTGETTSAEDMFNCLNLKSEHTALEIINRLEIAILAWKEKITEQYTSKSPVRTSWSFTKDPIFERDKKDALLDRAAGLLQQIKIKYPNLPQTFLGAIKIQYCKDVGHAILEAYSRVLSNLALSILARIGDILQEDVLSNPNSPVATFRIPGTNVTGVLDSPVLDRVRQSLLHQMNSVDESTLNSTNYSRFQSEEHILRSVTSTSSRSRVWCVGREACGSLSPQISP